MTTPHPLSALSLDETNLARDIVLQSNPGQLVLFRVIYLWEPAKDELIPFLEHERSGQPTDQPSLRPARCAQVHYDIVGGGGEKVKHHEAVADLDARRIIDEQAVSDEHQPSLTMYVPYFPALCGTSNPALVRRGNHR